MAIIHDQLQGGNINKITMPPFAVTKDFTNIYISNDREDRFRSTRMVNMLKSL